MLHNSYYHNNLIHISNLFFFPFKFSFSYQTLSGPRKKKQKVPEHFKKLLLFQFHFQNIYKIKIIQEIL